MVCLGNICRSPLAEGILRKYLNTKNFLIDSAGTSSYHIGNSPDQRSIDVGLKNNINIMNIKSRQFTEEDFENFDHIYVMDRKNLKDVMLISKISEPSDKVKLLIDNEEVIDPYFGGLIGFSSCFKVIDLACKKIASNFLKDE
ncbi:low molecular weight phosphotyrosine protein phosphatase [Flavobacteriaceae bacterium]|nr:low molecular weight phosphotyrosine protein phosphatase [Flavobacteriaceae bacterium]